MLAEKYHNNPYILYSIQEQKEYGSKSLASVLPRSPPKKKPLKKREERLRKPV